MINENGDISPAPWVPYTRDGCDVGNVATATQTVTVSAAQTLTAGDIVVRTLGVNKSYIGLQLATDNSQSSTSSTTAMMTRQTDTLSR